MRSQGNLPGEAPYLIAKSAFKHGISDSDIEHAYRNPIRMWSMDDEFTLIVGADTAGRLIEIGYVLGTEALVIIHAMPAREKFLR